MNPAAVAYPPPCAAVNLRLVPTTAPLRPLRQPQFLFAQTPDDFGADITQPHEAGASVPSLSAQTGAILNSIPLAACAAPLPSLIYPARESRRPPLSTFSLAKGSA